VILDIYPISLTYIVCKNPHP